MSKICVTTNISILIFISTCKKVTQSESMEFSKNGVFHSKDVVIIFLNDQIEFPILSLPFSSYDAQNVENCDCTPSYAITAENISKLSNKSNSIKKSYLQKFWTSKPISTNSNFIKRLLKGSNCICT